MCGFAGILDLKRARTEGALRADVDAMTRVIRHRGPDDEGHWIDASRGIALGFRRLSIIDLSEAGHQPMLDASGRYVVVFNGEVYNFQRIRAELENEVTPRFRGHSDTEVILEAIAHWGLEAAVRRFIGMFAMAIWDRDEETLHLVRDRVGIKPLYVGRWGRTILFGSELKALAANPAFEPDLDRDAIASFLRYSYIGAPSTVYRDVSKVEPGTIVTIRADGSSETNIYWSATDIARRARTDRFRGTEEDAVNELEEILRDSVSLRQIADVPLGVFLSGGVDSSTVAAMMSLTSSSPPRSFTIGFEESDYDEARHARAVARHLGTDHVELYLSPGETMRVIPDLATIWDEPFGDSSQVPTLLVSKLARKHVTVALSGDGGDELFGGYNRYFWGRDIWNAGRRLPAGLRRFGAGAISALPPAALNSVWSGISKLLPRGMRISQPGDKLLKAATVLGASDADDVYERLISIYPDEQALLTGGVTAPPVRGHGLDSDSDISESMMLRDFLTYLPDDILVKVDRASMAVSLEAREPLLDHRIVEFAARLPVHFKIRDGKGKWILRRVLYRHVPGELIERPKMGFSIPLDSWLRNDLRDWVEALLDRGRLEEQGLVDPDAVRKLWEEHRKGTRNRQYILWNLLMLQSWLDHNGSAARSIEPRRAHA